MYYKLYKNNAERWDVKVQKIAFTAFICPEVQIVGKGFSRLFL